MSTLSATSSAEVDADLPLAALVALHLAPGVMSFSVIALALVPALSTSLGIPAQVLPLVTYLAAIALVTIPVLLLFLAWRNRRATQRWGLRAVIGLRTRGRPRSYLILVPLFAWMMFCFIVLAGWANEPITRSLFSWFPQGPRFQQLFSAYHLFSPWENPVRIIATLPMVWLAWRRDDILIAAIPHLLANTLGGLGVLWLAFA